MKWKLKKDLPWSKAGTIWDEDTSGSNRSNVRFMSSIDSSFGSQSFPADSFSEWFEPLEERRWEPKDGENYFYFIQTGHVGSQVNWQFSPMKEQSLFGNCFKTREDAEKASLVIREALKKFHEENK